MARLRHALGNLALAVAATAVTLVGIEAWLRFRGAFDMQATPGCYQFSENPRLMYDMKPRCEGTNSAGIKDDEIDPDVPGTRIAAVGDSVTFGPSAKVHETWPNRLEQMLARAGRPAVVWNFGVQGYSTVQEVETLRVKALPLRPQIALLQYFMNDEEVYTTIFNAVIDDMRRRGEEGYLDALDPRHGWLARRLLLSRTAIAVRVGLAKVFPPPPQKPEDNVITSYYSKRSPVREGLTALRELAETNDLKALVLVFPHAWGARADRAGGIPLPELTEWPKGGWVFDTKNIMRLCGELGFTCVDIAERMYARPKLRAMPGHLVFGDGCCHLTPRGHKVMAWVVMRELLSLGWVGQGTVRGAR